MSKFNTPGTKPAIQSPIQSETTASGQTFEGGPGYGRDARSELFLLAVTNLVGEKTFYEASSERDQRFRDLINRVGFEDGGIGWLAGLWPWLRQFANMRTAPLVGALETAKLMHDRGIPGARPIVSSALQRPDEPGEALAYWVSRYGRALPMSVKHGVGDAAKRLYSQRSLLKYDTSSRAYRFADVIELTRPKPTGPEQSALFRHAIDRRHGRGTSQEDVPAILEMIHHNRVLRAMKPPEAWLDHDNLALAGMTWEDALSAVGSKVDKARLWEAMIPSMGYMALLRNLRNFDEAGVSDDTAAAVGSKLANPTWVAKSRQLPMRFLSAYRAAPSLRWAYSLEQALGHSMSSIPTQRGRTLILVDTSSSMHASFSRDGTLMRWDAAALFGIALGHRCESADVVSFSSAQRYVGDPRGSRVKAFPLKVGESLLRSIERWTNDGYFLGGGTDTAGALRDTFHDHTRVVILTDEQAAYGRYGEEVSRVVPEITPLVTFNLAGYQHGQAPSGPNRVTVGGLSDQAFTMLSMLSMLDIASSGRWPWEHENAS